MLHACVQRFDVTENLEKFSILEENGTSGGCIMELGRLHHCLLLFFQKKNEIEMLNAKTRA